MSKQGITITILATELSKAIKQDEESTGCDLSAGLFGRNVSDWIRNIAVLIVTNNNEPQIGGIEKYTKNGEITFNIESKIYTVWNESYSDVIGSTPYPKIAEKILETYAAEYL